MQSTKIAQDASMRKRKQRSKQAQLQQQTIRDRRKRIRSTCASDNTIPKPDEHPGNDVDKISEPPSYREHALRNITQFREAPITEDNQARAIVLQMNQMKQQIRKDLTNHIMEIDPAYYCICSCCGHQIHKQKSLKPSKTTLDSWLLILKSMIYVSDTDVVEPSNPAGTDPSHIPDHLRFVAPALLPFVAKKHREALFYMGGLSITAFLLNFHVFRGMSDSLFLSAFPAYMSGDPRVVSQVDVNCDRVRQALYWLKQNNPLYNQIEIDELAITDIDEVQRACVALKEAQQNSESNLQSYEQPSAVQDVDVVENDTGRIISNTSSTSAGEGVAPSEVLLSSIASEELAKGTQGPLDVEALESLSKSMMTGVEDMNNSKHAELLIQHILRPFSHRRNEILPCYDAESYLESYFPVLFPYGTGGPISVQCQLGVWVKHALSVFGSRFAQDIDFIFFIFSVLKRKRLTGLASHAPIRQASTSAIIEVRDLLSSSAPDYVIEKRIDKLLRSGTLNASFETLRGSAAFWAALKRTSWAYLTTFGPCQLFITISAADLIDPYVYLQIDPTLSIHTARKLSPQQRADLLARNPVAATTIFHRRVQSILNHFLFGESRPFQELVAYLGRIEQQARHSPHLHLLIWLDKKSPKISGNPLCAKEVADFVELFCTALLPEDQLTPQAQVPPVVRTSSIPKYNPL